MLIRVWPVLLALALFAGVAPGEVGDTRISGQVLDPRGKAVTGAAVRLRLETSATATEARSDSQGRYELSAPAPGACELIIEAPGFAPESLEVLLDAGASVHLDVQFRKLAPRSERVTVSARVMDPATDLREADAYDKMPLARDDQMLQRLSPGIDAGQHEGGGKSLEIRRFGFNLDHGGVNGGLKVLVDGVQQNQGTQGHGQGYLGSLKALSPELIQEVVSINGPFSAEYGDFSGLGVVAIKQRESLPDVFTIRTEAGDFHTSRAFLAYSPDVPHADAYVAYEGSYTDGPFQNPVRYRRDNVNANFTKRLSETEKLGLRFLFGRNDFYSSGQIPLDLVDEHVLNRYGYIDPTDGGRVKLGTVAASYNKELGDGRALKASGFLSRSLFDLYSNSTYFLHDPVHGDAIQQHDSRLEEGANVQYMDPHHVAGMQAMLVTGAELLDGQVNVGLYPREGRTPTGVETRADAQVDNSAAYIQENVSMWRGRLLVGGGLRYDRFHYSVRDLVTPAESGDQSAGRWQGKGSAAMTPSRSAPLTLHLNYGRGINSIDARAVVQRPYEPRLATTDFYQTGASLNFGRLGVSADAFLIDHSNEQVYIPDDGSFEFKGPSRAYGYEAKLSTALSRHVSLDGGFTKIANAFYKGGDHRVYVDSAPHFVANASLRVAVWHGWSGSLGMRAINHYRLDGELAGIVAAGHTVFDLGIARAIRRGVQLNLSVDNLTNRAFYETQNYFGSRVSPTAPMVARIHGTPRYPLTLIGGLTFRLRGK
jgi:TonB-dependent receptor-like protein/carboxypeptidase family protein